jgi:hypothetical protein
MFMRHSITLLISLPMLLHLAGCGGSQVDKPLDSEAHAGVVDPTLPPAVQAQQDAIIRLFSTIQRGVGFEYLPDEVEGVTIEESQADFFGDASDLYRWEFVGPPDQNRHTIKMVFRLDQPGFPTKEEQRTYLVVPSGGKFTVRRASS